MLQVGDGDQGAHIDGVDDAAAAQKGQQVQSAHGRALRVVMQRGIGMRAHMRRQGDGTHVHGACFGQGGRPLLGVRRVARKDRTLCASTGGEMSQSLSKVFSWCAKVALPKKPWCRLFPTPEKKDFRRSAQAGHGGDALARKRGCLLQIHDKARDAIRRCHKWLFRPFFHRAPRNAAGLWSVPRMRQVCSVMGEASPAGTSPPLFFVFVDGKVHPKAHAASAAGGALLMGSCQALDAQSQQQKSSIRSP